MDRAEQEVNGCFGVPAGLWGSGRSLIEARLGPFCKPNGSVIRCLLLDPYRA